MRKRHSGETEPHLITIRVFADELEANLAKSALQAASIDCMIVRDDCGDAYPPLSWARGIKLVVRSEDAELATEVLARQA